MDLENRTNIVAEHIYAKAVTAEKIDTVDPRSTPTKVADTIQNSNDAEKTTAAGTYTKIKETKINETLAGTVRIKYDYNAYNQYPYNPPQQCYFRLYKNGSPLGDEVGIYSDAEGGGTYQTKSQDFTGITKDDLIQVYAHGDGSIALCLVRNLRICYEISVMRDTTNQDPT